MYIWVKPSFRSLPTGKFCMLFCHLLFFFKINFSGKILFGIPSECQTIWIQVKPDNLSGLIWVQTVCKGYQQMTLIGKDTHANISRRARGLSFGLSRHLCPYFVCASGECSDETAQMRQACLGRHCSHM